MSTYKVNENGKKVAVGFNNSAGTLIGRETEWDVLAEIAVYSKDQTLIGLFEKLPSIEEWDRIKGIAFVENQSTQLEATPKAPAPVKP
jgi:hypothetical protein